MSDPTPARDPEHASTVAAEAADAGAAAAAPDGRYRRLSTLGLGAMGEVTACFDPDLQRVVARKRLIRPSARVARMMAHEARLVAYLDHPGVVPIYALEDLGSGQPAYTMKVLQGQTLWDWMRGRLEARALPSVAEVVQIITRLSETMANAHDKGVLHLDLKASNVMLEPLGSPIIIDWGLAYVFDPAPYRQALAQAGASVDLDAAQPRLRGPAGTPAYMSPEQLLGGRETLGPAADIFAVGVLFFRMLTFRSPFDAPEGVDLAALGRRRLQQPVPSVQRARADVAAGIAAICEKMLAPERSERFQSFHAVLAALREVADIGRCGQVRTFQPGDVLIREGAPADGVFLVLSGEVEISIESASGRKVLARRGPGEILGEMAILSDRPRSATVVATQVTEARALSTHMLESELDKVPPLIRNLLRLLSDRLIEQTQRERVHWGTPPN